MSPRYRDIFDEPIFQLGEHDYLTPRMMPGLLGIGDPGSGKSTTLFRQLFLAYARIHFGILFHAIKPGDAEMALAWAEECGRERDVIVVSEASGLRFDALAYEWSRTTSRGGGDVESLIAYFTTLLNLGKPQSGGNTERFWELASEQAMRNSIKVIQLAGETPSIVNVHRAISSFPEHLRQEEEQGWLSRSYTAALIDSIRQRKDSLSEEQWQDLETATDFIFHRWATLDERPRSSIAMTFAGMSDKFLFHPLKGLFASGAYDFTPEQITHEHKIVIVDYAPLEYGRETAQLINVMIQLTCQRAWLRHQYKPGCCNGAALLMDEFQILMHRFQNQFVQVSRSSGVCVVALTQTILNVAEELGETQPGAKTKAYLANLGVKVALRTTCPDSAAYFSSVVGSRYEYLDNFNASGDAHHQHASFGGSRQLVPQIEPGVFSALTRPDAFNPLAEAIVFRGGDLFNANHRNYLRVLLTRE